MTAPLLSIVIPAHNEESRLPQTLERIDAFLKTQPFTAEVVVVENASQDRTLVVAQDYASRLPYLTVIHEDRRGKGLACQVGMLAAKGQFRFICDADLSMPIEEVTRFIPPAMDADVAIASREGKDAKRYGEPAYRHFVGRGFNLLVRLLALPGLQDTQCGFKCFRGSVVDEIFPLQTIMGWTFDVELLFIARRRGYTIREVGIPWYFNPESKIRVRQDSTRMFLDLLAIRRNAANGVYDSKVVA